MDQLIVTKWKDRSLTALLSDGHCRSLTLESGDESLLGNIYIGKVKNVVKNINAAFIDLGGTQRVLCVPGRHPHDTASALHRIFNRIWIESSDWPV